MYSIGKQEYSASNPINVKSQISFKSANNYGSYHVTNISGKSNMKVLNRDISVKKYLWKEGKSHE